MIVWCNVITYDIYTDTYVWWGRRGRDLQLSMQSVPITTSEFEPRSWRDVLDTTLCDTFCQ